MYPESVRAENWYFAVFRTRAPIIGILGLSVRKLPILTHTVPLGDTMGDMMKLI